MPESANSTAAETTEPAAPPREPTVAALKSWCFRDRGSTCARCAQACPKQAIGFDEDGKPAIDAQRCSDCGICLGICDNFAFTEVTFEDLWQRFNYHNEKSGCVYLCCRESIFPGFEPALNVVVLPCLAALPPLFWTLLLASGIDLRVYADMACCDVCDIAAPNGRALWEYGMQQAQQLCGREFFMSDDIAERGNIISEFVKAGSLDRRSILTDAIGGANDITSGAYLARNTDASLDARLRREKMRADGRVRNGDRNPNLPSAFAYRVETPTRFLQKELARIAPDVAARIPRTASATDERACDHCAGPTGKSFACTEACPTGARRKVFGKEMLEYDGDYCIGCGLCVPACPHKAITLRRA